MNIDACSACTARYGIENLNSLNDCCYNTCSSFISGNVDDIINSQCGENCKKCISQSLSCKGKTECSFKPKIPLIKSRPQNFKTCLEETPNDTKNALGCCIKQCNTNECKEHCIDAYNSLIFVNEGFIFGKMNRPLLFLFFILSFNTLLQYKYIILSTDIHLNLFFKILIYITGYYVIMYIL